MAAFDTDAESLIMQDQSARARWSRKAGLIAGAVGLALVGTAGVATKRFSVNSGLDALQVKEERVEIEPSFAACSKSGENCFETKCCQVSGHKCYTKSHGISQCNETCTPGKGFSCGVMGEHSVPAQPKAGNTIYCFSVYTENTGSPKPSTELDLLTNQMKYGVSIFTCDLWDVFADVAVPLGNGYTTIQVEDKMNNFHQIKRKTSGTWVNWAMFYQVWVKIREVGKWQQTDYTVKVDADAVFIPPRLRTWLNTKYESPHGVYYENCKNVQYGFFGNLEVISKTAVSVLTTYLEDCYEVFAPCANEGCDWKWGPWGEDVFAQRCMDHHYVDKVEAFDLTTDGACAANRPAGEKKNKKWHATDCSALTTAAAHPYKKTAEYFKCLGEMTQTPYNL